MGWYLSFELVAMKGLKELPCPLTMSICFLESNFTYQDVIDLQKKKQNFGVPRKKNQTSGVWTIHTSFCVCAPWKPSFSCSGTKCSGHLYHRLWCTDFIKVRPCSICSLSFHNWRLPSATENSFSRVRCCILLSSTSCPIISHCSCPMAGLCSFSLVCCILSCSPFSSPAWTLLVQCIF